MKRDVLTFLLFLFLAACIWYGHAMNSVRNTRVPVLIQYTGKPSAIALDEQLPDTVMIEVRDAGSRLNSYHKETLRLTIDLHPYIHGERGTIHVPSDALRRSISDILQGTSRLIETRPEEITCTYFTEQEKSVPIVSRCDIQPAAEYQLVGAPTLGRTRLKLFGQDKTLQQIDTIFTEARTFEQLCDTSVLRVALDIPRKVRAEVDNVTGVPEGRRIRLFPPEVEVTARVGMAHFNEVQPTDLHAVCRYSPEHEDKLDVELSYTNRFITAAWVYPGVVEFLMEQ